MDIKITTGKTSDTTYYVADIKLSSADYLKMALAQNTYGTNLTETTSSIAQQNNAIFAINADYYGANQSGYVIKNGQVYRDTDRNSDYEDLAVYSDKDGTKSGFDLEMLNRVAEVVDVPIIASGGAGNIEDIVEVFEKTTATGALAASIFHFGEVNIGETKQVLAKAGIEVRR